MTREEDLVFVADLYLALRKTINKKKDQVEDILRNIEIMEKEQEILMKCHMELLSKKCE